VVDEDGSTVTMSCFRPILQIAVMKHLFRDNATTDMADEIPGLDVSIAFVNLPANYEDAVLVSRSFD